VYHFRLSKRFLCGIACALMLAANVSNARAGSLELIVTESGGGGPIVIADGSVFDTSILPGVITVDTSLLNTFLVSYQFSDLGALSNALTAGAVASLSQTGTVELLFGSPASTISVVATDIDWSSPSGGVATLNSSTSNTFTHTDAGNTQTFQSWYNPSNALAGMEVPSSLLLLTSTGAAPNSHADDSPDTLAASAKPFGLTNELIINLTGGTSTAQSKDQFTGSTTLITSGAVPEPASLALMAIGLPLTVIGIRYRRRKTA